MHRRIAALAVALALAPLAATAADINYSFLDAGWVRIDPDGISKSADGFGLRGSVGVTEDIFLFANYSDVSLNYGGASLDEKDYSVGAGYAYPVSDRASLYGKVAWARVDADFLGENLTEDGYSVAVGLRGRPAEKVELEGAVTYTDFSNLGSTTSVDLGARYYFVPTFAVGLEASLSDDAKMYMAGFRWQWGG